MWFYMVMVTVRVRVNFTLLVTIIIQHYRCIITQYKYVNNALLKDTLRIE